MRMPKLATVTQKKINTETLEKRKVAVEKPKKASKKESGAPKRPASAFLIFMSDFRKSFKENYPDNKSIATVGKAGGEKWKSMSEVDKAPYLAKAKLKKDEYEIAMKEFKQKTTGNAVEMEKSEGSVSNEAHDDNSVSS